jgi:hypothetical protein
MGAHLHPAYGIDPSLLLGHRKGSSPPVLPGLEQAGQHWRRKFPSPNSPVQYHLDHCQNAMSEATALSAHLLEPSVKSARSQQKTHRAKPVRQRLA